MKPPYEISSEILTLISQISEQLGVIKTMQLDRPITKLRKANRIMTIHHSLSIEGNTLELDQVTALMDGKRVRGTSDEILEVENAIKTYGKLDTFKASDYRSFLQAHGILMKGLDKGAGSYRKTGVAVAKGESVAHIAPPASRVSFLVKDLFDYLKDDEELALIKSCVCHYEIEFIHPFKDGNGRMGRLWQTVILMESNPVFAFLPVEQLIHDAQHEYYQVLSECDKAGQSTAFIVFMLGLVQQSLASLIAIPNPPMNQAARLQYFLEKEKGSFSRKDYLTVFHQISSATASRDLSYGVEEGLIEKEGEKRLARYRVVE